MINKHKYIIFTGVGLFSLILIWLLGQKTNLNKTINTTNLAPKISDSTTSGKISGQNNTQIEWTNTSPIKTTPLYLNKISKYISNLNSSYVAEKFGFSSKNKSNNSRNEVQIWRKEGETLIINLSNNSLTYHKDAPNTPITTTHSSDSITDKARSFLEKLLDKQIFDTLQPFSLAYYQRKSIYTFLSTQEKANIFRVSFTQTIDGLQTVTQSETGATITIYLDSNLDIYQVQIKNLFSKPQINSPVSVKSIEELIKDADQEIIRLSTNSDLGTNFEIASKETIDLKQHKINLGYLIYPNIAIPSYIIQGDIKTKNGIVTEVYALPLTTTPAP